MRNGEPGAAVAAANVASSAAPARDVPGIPSRASCCAVAPTGSGATDRDARDHRRKGRTPSGDAACFLNKGARVAPGCGFAGSTPKQRKNTGSKAGWVGRGLSGGKCWQRTRALASTVYIVSDVCCRGAPSSVRGGPLVLHVAASRAWGSEGGVSAGRPPSRLRRGRCSASGARVCGRGEANSPLSRPRAEPSTIWQRQRLRLSCASAFLSLEERLRLPELDALQWRCCWHQQPAERSMSCSSSVQ